MQCIGDYPCSEEEEGAQGSVLNGWLSVTIQHNTISYCQTVAVKAFTRYTSCMTYNVMHLDQSLARCLDLEILWELSARCPAWFTRYSVQNLVPSRNLRSDETSSRPCLETRPLRVVVFDFESSSSRVVVKVRVSSRVSSSNSSGWQRNFGCHHHQWHRRHFVKVGLDTKIVQSLPWNCVAEI